MSHHHEHEHGQESERRRWDWLFREIAAIRETVMTVSAEVQAILDEARESQSIVASVDLGIKGLQSQVTDLQAQIAALQAGQALSADDKAALVEAAGDLRTSLGPLTDAVLANVDQSKPAADKPLETQVRDVPRSDDGKALPIAAPAIDAPAAPLMPNMAFDPAAGNAGQAGHAPALETAGGFVVAGGGAVSRAVGSLPDSPSSTIAVPVDPEAKGPDGPAVVGPDGVATAIPPGGEASADPAKVDPGRMAAPNAPFGGPAPGQEGGPANASAPAPASDVGTPPPNAGPVPDASAAPVPSDPPPSPAPILAP